MKFRDLLTVGSPHSHGYTCAKHVLETYWELEQLIAYEQNNSFSDIEDRDPRRRTCRICGYISDTDESGTFPRECANQMCQAVREFWVIYPYPMNNRIGSVGNKKTSTAATRAFYLKARIKAMFGQPSLSEIPSEIKLDFLIMTMIERIAHEANN